MKIAAIITEHTNKNQVALRTDPPVTDEILSALRKILNDSSFPTRKSQDGLIIVSLPFKERGAIPFLEARLTEAENQVEADKKEADETRKKFLDGISKELGLPLE